MLQEDETKKLKNTRGRKIVLDVLKKNPYPLTCEDIYKLTSKSGINLSTVYRTLNSFVSNGIVKKEVGEDKRSLFSLVQKEDHHVLVCVKCHKRIELEGCPYHEVNDEISKETGYEVLDHNTEIYGICPDCQKKNGN